MKKKDYADVIKLRILRWGDCPGLSRCALNAIRGIFIRGRFHADTGGQVNWPWKQRLKWYSHKPRNVDSHQRLEKARKHILSRKNKALPTPWSQPTDIDFGLLTSRIMREVSDILSHLVCSNYVMLSQETNIDGNCFKTPLFSTFLKSSKSQVEGGVENRVLRLGKILCADTGVLNSICDLQHVESENKQRK